MQLGFELCCIPHWICFYLSTTAFVFVLLQLLESILSEIREAMQSKNNFVEVHLNGSYLRDSGFIFYIIDIVLLYSILYLICFCYYYFCSPFYFVHNVHFWL